MNEADATWTRQELVVYGAQLGGGNDAATEHAVGLAYDHDTDAWRRLPEHPLSPQACAVAWTGEVRIAYDYRLQAASYDPAADAWTPLPALPLDPAECYPDAVAVRRRRVRLVLRPGRLVRPGDQMSGARSPCPKACNPGPTRGLSWRALRPRAPRSCSPTTRASGRSRPDPIRRPFTGG